MTKIKDTRPKKGTRKMAHPAHASQWRAGGRAWRRKG